MNAHLLRLGVAAERLDDLRPDRTHSAEFCDLQEEVRPHREAERNLSCRLVDRQPALTQRTQIRRRRRQTRCDLLHIVCTAAAVDIAADKHRAQMRRMCRRPACRRSEAVIVCVERCGELAVGHECADRVGPDDALYLRHILSCRTACRRDEREDRECVRPRIDIERELRKIKPLKERVHIVDRRHARTDVADLLRLTCIHTRTRSGVEHDMVDRRALVILMAQELVVLCGQGLITRLCDAPRLPDVAGGIHAAQIVPHTGHDTLGQDVLRVFLRIHGVEGDALVGLREHDLLEGRPLEQRLAGRLPLLVRRRSEFVERDLGEVLNIRRFLQKLLKFLVTRPFFFFRHSTSSFNLLREGSASSMN